MEIIPFLFDWLIIGSLINSCDIFQFIPLKSPWKRISSRIIASHPVNHFQSRWWMLEDASFKRPLNVLGQCVGSRHWPRMNSGFETRNWDSGCGCGLYFPTWAIPSMFLPAALQSQCAIGHTARCHCVFWCVVPRILMFLLECWYRELSWVHMDW